MKNAEININAIAKIATALGDLNKQVVYVGGAVVSLYVDDWADDDVRPTKDIDIYMQILSHSALEKLREDLVAKGFIQTAEDKVMCRFRFEDIRVDVMSTEEIGWAPANPWFKPGLRHVRVKRIDDIEIRILPYSYFLATKYSAFKDRGSKDPRSSHDLEDIAYLLDYRSNLVKSIIKSPEDVLIYLKTAFSEILNDEKIQEAILANLYYVTQAERFNILTEKLTEIVNSNTE